MRRVEDEERMLQMEKGGGSYLHWVAEGIVPQSATVDSAGVVVVEGEGPLMRSCWQLEVAAAA